MEILDLSWDFLDLVSVDTITQIVAVFSQSTVPFNNCTLSRFLLCFLGKKARTFDFNAIFEQTRRTAIERSQRVLGKFVTRLFAML